MSYYPEAKSTRLLAIYSRLVSEDADGGGWVIEAEVFGKGIEALIRAQGGECE